MSWEFIIPMEVPSQNRTMAMHWRKRHAWGMACERCVRAYGASVPRATGKRSLHIHAWRKQRCKDTANLIGGAKQLVDSLVRAGLLLDDSSDLMVDTYSQATLATSPVPKRAVTRITLEDIP